MKRLLLLLTIISSFSYGQMRIETKKYSADGQYNVATPTHKPIEGVIYFMGGMGERGTDINSPDGPYRNELPKMLRDTAEYPYIIVWQQLSPKKTDWTSAEINAIFPILDLLAGNLPKHVTGLSLGGRGVHLAIRLAYIYNGNQPGYFTTAGAVCGSTALGSGTNLSDTLAYKGNLKLHLWHGEADTTVKPALDKGLVKILQPVMKSNLSYTWYAGEGHNIWSKVYRTEYFQWIKSVSAPVYTVENPAKILVVNGVLYLETDKGNRYVVQLTKIQ